MGRRRGLLVVVVAVVLGVGLMPVGAQNALTGPARVAVDDRGPIDLWRGRPLLVAYDAAASWPGGDVVQATWRHRLTVDAGPGVTLEPTCPAGAAPYACRAPLPHAAVTALRVPGVHRLAITVASPGTEAGTFNESAPALLQVETPAGCTYAPPGSTTTALRPRYQEDPVAGSLQGFNPLAGQAARIAQLRAWGWRVEWQFVDGSARADKVDRLVLLAFCEPLAVQG